ncbi:MAG: hypothetical protein HYX80_08145, partial [Chloroflexi bacterium]|nr:hypothetical protein [Chloroflexota bacterium]
MAATEVAGVKSTQEVSGNSTQEASLSLRLVPFFEKSSRVASVAAALIGGTVLFGGWGLDNPGLQNLIPGLPKMMPNTALGLLLSGASLFLSGFAPRKRGIIWIARFLAAAVAALGIATLAEYALGGDLGIDQLLFKDVAPGATYPGRPSPQTSFAFVLTGISVLLWGGRLWML